MRRLSAVLALLFFVTLFARSSGAEGGISGFSLVDARSGESIKGFTGLTASSMRLQITSLPFRNITLRPDIDSYDHKGSVVLSLDGKVTAVMNHPPYSLFGQHEDEALPWFPPRGSHRITASLFDGKNGGGKKVASRTITIVAVHGEAKILGLSLIDADKDRPVRYLTYLKNGQKINLRKAGVDEVNIAAVVTKGMFSYLQFSLNGIPLSREGAAPYAAWGDDDGDYVGWALPPGDYDLRVKGYVPTSTRVAAETGVKFTIVDAPGTGGTSQNASAKNGPKNAASRNASAKKNLTPPRDNEKPLGEMAPLFALWEKQMVEYGKRHCEAMKSGARSNEENLAATYYDPQYVFYRIGDYTGDSSFHDCAALAGRTYRELMVDPSGGRAPGYWIFTRGLREEYARTGNKAAKAAVLKLAEEGAFASDYTEPSSTVNASLSRETAYVMEAYIDAERLGAPRRERLDLLERHALGHLEQWFSRANGRPVMKPFMVGLTARSLIDVTSWRRQSGLPERLAKALDAMWASSWIHDRKAFKYQSWADKNGGTEAAPDLNLLIAPAYEWVYQKTGEIRFRERADLIFEGGVRDSYLENPKQFNQNYRWSFDYVKWRRGN